MNESRTHTIKKTCALAVYLLAIFLLAACATFPTSRPTPPTVKVLSVNALKLGLREQKLALQLQINNPNPFDLPLQTLSFVASLDATDIAQGVSTEPVTLPAKGDALLVVEVSTKLNRALGRLLLLASDPNTSVNYDIKGFVKLANWPTRIPFNVDGNLDKALLE